MQQQIAELYVHAKACAATQRWYAALVDYTQIIEQEPSAAAYVGRGLVACEIGKRDHAWRDFEHAMELDPRYGPAYYGRGWLRNAGGDYQGELEDARNGLALDPEHPAMYQRRIGAAYQGLKQYECALSTFTHAIALDPRDAATFYARGRCYQETGDYSRALNDFGHALELRPGWAWALTGRAMMHFKLNAPEEALTDLSAALRAAPDYALAHYVRGLIYKDLQQPVQAERAFAEAHRLDARFNHEVQSAGLMHKLKIRLKRGLGA